jgi:hypothetical protein
MPTGTQQSVVIITAYTYGIRRGLVFAVNNQNCLSIVLFCTSTSQHLTAIMSSKFGSAMGLGVVGTSFLLSRSHPM